MHGLPRQGCAKSGFPPGPALRRRSIACSNCCRDAPPGSPARGAGPGHPVRCSGRTEPRRRRSSRVRGTDCHRCRGGGPAVPRRVHEPGGKRAAHTIVCLINAQRTRHGVPRLQPSGDLARAARAARSRHGATRLLRPRSPGGSSPVPRAPRTPATTAVTIAENLAFGTGSWGTPAGTVAQWLGSPPHRAALFARVCATSASAWPTAAPAPASATSAPPSLRRSAAAERPQRTSSRTAVPTSSGRTIFGDLGSVPRRFRSMSRPAPSITLSVARLQLQPPLNVRQTGAQRSCERASRGSSLRTCSGTGSGHRA